MDVAIVAAIIGASAAVVAVLGAQVITNIFANRREQGRQEHEQALKEMELEDKRQEKLREERIRAYTHLLFITATIRTNEPYRVDDLAEALSEIQLLAGSDKVLTAAGELHEYGYEARKKAREVKKSGQEPTQDAGYRSAYESLMVTRSTFLEASREELGLPLQVPPTGLSIREITVSDNPSTDRR